MYPETHQFDRPRETCMLIIVKYVRGVKPVRYTRIRTVCSGLCNITKVQNITRVQKYSTHWSLFVIICICMYIVYTVS